MDERDVSSADQDAWVELAQAIRGQLLKTVEFMPAMKPEEIKTFIEAVRDALWFEINASDFDHELQLKRNRIIYQD